MRTKSLDHFVHLVKDLEKSSDAFKKLGFQVRPIATHIELGSANCVIQFDKTYYELIDLTKAEAWLTAPYMQRLAHGTGLAHVSLDSEDLVKDRERLLQLGLQAREIVSARRKVTMPDGTIDETDSKCSYVWREDNPYLSLFVSIHNKPETIFIPEYQNHENGALSIKKLVFLTTKLQPDIAYFSKHYGKEPDESSEDGFTMIGHHGDIAEVLARDRFEKEYGTVAHSDLGALKGLPKAVVLKVSDLQKTAHYFEQHAIPTTAFNTGLAIHEDIALGSTLIFEA